MQDFDIALLAPLIAYALWPLAMLVVLFFARLSAAAGGKRAVNTFKPYGDTEGLDAISRAHMNTIENLPVFTVVYLSALWTGADAPIGTLGWVAFGARVAQSLIHLASRTPNAVRLRALLLAVQLVCFVWLGVAALRIALVN